MADVIPEVVDQVKRPYFTESGGDLRKSSVMPQGLKSSKEVGMVSVKKEVSSAMERVKERLEEAGSPYDLSIDRDTNRVIIKMVDLATGIVERQFPEHSLIELSKRLENLTGSVFDART